MEIEFLQEVIRIFYDMILYDIWYDYDMII
jgi:hypothetical protein